MIVVTSVNNGRIKQCVKLRDRRSRDRNDKFLIEGYRELSRAVDATKTIEVLFYCPDLFLGTNEQTIISLLEGRGVEIIQCSEKVFRKISYRDRPDGLLAIAPQMNMTFDDFRNDTPPLIVVAEAIEKPGNLGTILRSSDASGVNGLVVCDRCTDLHNPNVVRASVGTLFTVPVVEAGSMETLEWLHENNIAIVATTPSAEQEYTDVDMTGPVAIVVGTEQLGLSQQWLDAADIAVKIPMMGIADSLNVATATTLLLYEVLRQRRS